VKRRVVITGIGVIAPNGIGKDNFWYALKTGRCGIKKISFFDTTDFPVKIAGEVRDFNPEEFIEKKKARKMARFSQFAVACSKMALEDAGLTGNTSKKYQIGIVIGVASTDIRTVEHQCKALYLKGNEKVQSFASAVGLPNAPASTIADACDINNCNFTVSTGCAAGLDAVGMAYQLIKEGTLNIVLSGGSDSPVTPVMLACLYTAGMVTKNDNPSKASRPFDRYRDGGVLSEGAAVIILEEMESALARGANIYGEVIGYGQSIETKEEKHGSGLKRAIFKSFSDADIDFETLSYVSAHGPSDKLLDLCETNVLKDVFGSCIYRIPVSSIKGHIGNPYSAAGVMQVISVVLGMKEDVIVPTINYEFPDPDCDLDYVPNYPRQNEINIALVNSHGLGGSSSSLLIRKVI
jgi:3-oxoacyl-[acyl-carrier-protein] synthase II